MAYISMAYIGMAYVGMAYIVITYRMVESSRKIFRESRTIYTARVGELGWAERVPSFTDTLAHADGERRRPGADAKVPEDASRRDLSDATLGIRHSSSAFAVGMIREKKRDPCSGER